MSGVLNRMVKRTLGMLPTVQPLMAPRFAPSAPALGEARVELPGPVALRGILSREAAKERRIAHLLNDRRDIRRPRDGTAEPRQNTDAERERGGVLGDSVRAAGEQVARAEVGTAPTANVSSRRVTASNSIASSESRQAESSRATERAGDAGMLPASAKQVKTRHVSISEESPYARGPMEERDGVRALTETREQQDAESRASNFRQRSSRAAGPTQRSEAAPTDEKTEIQITIGNIELRSARTEPRPQPAPFRPRVTLDEFLRRRPEAQR